MDEEIISLTAQIVSSHIANNEVSAAELPAFIREVHRALVTAGQTPAEQIKAKPSVALKKSVFADHIVCLDCGRGFKILKRHILTDHQMTPSEYRDKWNLPLSYPLVAADCGVAIQICQGKWSRPPEGGSAAVTKNKRPSRATFFVGPVMMADGGMSVTIA